MLVVGEAIDFAPGIVAANPDLRFQHVTLSPWRVDNLNIIQRMKIGDRYYLYNYRDLQPPIHILCDPIDDAIAIELQEKLEAEGLASRRMVPE